MGTEVVLHGDSGTDPLRRNEDADELPEYQAYWYRTGLHQRSRNGAGLGEVPIAVPSDFLPPVSFTTLRHTSSMSQLGPNVNFTLQLGDSSIQIGPLPLLQARAHTEPEGVFNQCMHASGGRAFGGVCWEYQRLQHLCVQVQPDGAGGWRLSRRLPTRERTYGCTFQGKHHMWEATGYSHVPPAQPGEGKQRWYAPNSTATFLDFGIEVRSAADPYFKAMELTAGSLSFGLTSWEEDVLAIVFLVMSAVFLMANLTKVCARKVSASEEEMAGFAQARYNRRYRKELEDVGIQPRQRKTSGAEPDLGSRDPDPETFGMRYQEDAPRDAPQRV